MRMWIVSTKSLWTFNNSPAVKQFVKNIDPTTVSTIRAKKAD